MDASVCIVSHRRADTRERTHARTHTRSHARSKRRGRGYILVVVRGLCSVLTQEEGDGEACLNWMLVL